MQSRFTLSQILSWHPCWDPTDVLTATGQSDWSVPDLWEHCRSDSERVWVATRPGVLAPCVLRQWLANVVERVLARLDAPDPRSLAVVGALRAAEPVSPKIVSEAYEAVYNCARYSYVAAYAATYAAGRTSAPEVYAYAATGVSGDRALQFAELRVLLKGDTHAI